MIPGHLAYLLIEPFTVADAISLTHKYVLHLFMC